LFFSRLTSNRRRWTHIFPKGPTGQYQQLHHLPNNQNTELSEMLQQISHGTTLQTGTGNIQNGTTGNDSNKQQQNSPSNDITIEQMWTATPQTGL